MDCIKTGRLICSLRKERSLTQKQLADKMNISDKTISKWERGLGCPDVSLLHELADALGVSIEKLLSGDLDPNTTSGGNMKKLNFYLCPDCGNVITSANQAAVTCCGRMLEPLSAAPFDEAHSFKAEDIDGEYYISFSHEMTKEHYIVFAAYVSYDRVLLIRLFPEQGGEFRMPELRGGTFYMCCNTHGLFSGKLK